MWSPATSHPDDITHEGGTLDLLSKLVFSLLCGNWSTFCSAALQDSAPQTQQPLFWLQSGSGATCWTFWALTVHVVALGVSHVETGSLHVGRQHVPPFVLVAEHRLRAGRTGSARCTTRAHAHTHAHTEETTKNQQ